MFDYETFLFLFTLNSSYPTHGHVRMMYAEKVLVKAHRKHNIILTKKQSRQNKVFLWIRKIVVTPQLVIREKNNNNNNEIKLISKLGIVAWFKAF